MEWAVCTASSDSEDATTQEKDEEKGAPSNTGHQGSLCGVTGTSSNKDAQGYINLPFIKAASARNGWESMESVKAEAREKPPHKDMQDLVHFEKRDRNKLSVPECMRSTFSVNITEKDGLSDRKPKVLITQALSKYEQSLVTQEDNGESTDELEFDSSTAASTASQTSNIEVIRRDTDTMDKPLYTKGHSTPIPATDLHIDSINATSDQTQATDSSRKSKAQRRKMRKRKHYFRIRLSKTYNPDAIDYMLADVKRVASPSKDQIVTTDSS